ncbi:4Fe-4S cluster-binding domain-containing protein [Nocardia sp. NPDC059240]|uniref:4Fe-4S cluster-binding domain-containing protein n=1 Tax=Nocardia sp. NPDC059240 TaxID=3346786 RepID=UPI0036CE1715
MTPPSMLLSRLHYPVGNLGYGVRAGVWFQGCTVGCRGCLARDTWPADERTRCDVERVLSWLRGIDGPLDGVTVSGGEPTDQPTALRALLEGIRRTDHPLPLDILLYSGRSRQRLEERFDWLTGLVDVLVSEPFVAARAGADALRGSSNQRVHVLSELGAQRYHEAALRTTFAAQRRELGVHVDGECVRLVGIPLPGATDALGRALTARGVEVRDASWLA